MSLFSSIKSTLAKIASKLSSMTSKPSSSSSSSSSKSSTPSYSFSPTGGSKTPSYSSGYQTSTPAYISPSSSTAKTSSSYSAPKASSPKYSSASYTASAAGGGYSLPKLSSSSGGSYQTSTPAVSSKVLSSSGGGSSSSRPTITTTRPTTSSSGSSSSSTLKAAAPLAAAPLATAAAPKPTTANQSVLTSQLSALQSELEQRKKELAIALATENAQEQDPYELREKERYVSDLEAQQKAIQDELAKLSAPTDAELDAQRQLDNIIASKELGVAAAADEPVPMGFITGYQTGIERRASTQAEPLRVKLAAEQARRQSALDAAKLRAGFSTDAVDRATKDLTSARDYYQNAIKPINLGNELVQLDPLTGEYKAAYKGTSSNETKTYLTEARGRRLLIDAQGNIIADLGPTFTASTYNPNLNTSLINYREALTEKALKSDSGREF